MFSSTSVSENLGPCSGDRLPLLIPDDGFGEEHGSVCQTTISTTIPRFMNLSRSMRTMES